MSKILMNHFTSPLRGAFAVCAVSAIFSAAAFSETAPASPDLTGVYQSISADTVLTGGLKNSGSPSAVPLTPAARDQLKSIDPKTDPGRICLPIGPFRMMASDRVKIELAPGPGYWVMMFEDISRGHMRVIYTMRDHPAKFEPAWLGDSIGRWDGSTLVVDSTGFSDRVWLNEAGAQHSEGLHLTERIRPILKGKYLEYKVTAQDPKALTKPYTYTRYFEKLGSEIMEDFCEAE
jgi:hypothetical protein